MKALCIYHGNCADGFGAAWAVRQALGDIDFHPGVYQDLPPDVSGRDVILVDFSYKRPVLDEMSKVADSILILDHHKSASEDLADLPNPGQSYADWQDNPARMAALFDMERSGAGIAWDFFHDAVRPRLIDHIEDRDLWRFALKHTREIQAAVFSYSYDFQTWDWLMRDATLEELAVEGRAIERKHHKDVAELVKVVTRPMRIAGTVVPMANLPYTLTSDAGHLLCGDEYPFAGCFWFTPEGWVFSLRSREGGADVGEIAKQYGGGGHKHASGFRVPFDQLEQFLP